MSQEIKLTLNNTLYQNVTTYFDSKVLITVCKNYYCHVTFSNISAETAHNFRVVLQVQKGMKNYISGESLILEYKNNPDLDMYSEAGPTLIAVPFVASSSGAQVPSILKPEDPNHPPTENQPVT